MITGDHQNSVVTPRRLTGEVMTVPTAPSAMLTTTRPTTRRRDGQSGFALITVLAVIALTSVVIGALFGLLYTTMRVTEAQERSAREGRAADGAIESAINQMRTAPCDPTTPFLAGQEFDQQTLGAGDDVAVDVDCAPAGSATGSSIDQVRIVGTDGYQGAMRWTEDCASNAVGCMPWSVASSLQGAAAGSNTALVHSGPEPLAFSSGVTVRTGSVGLRSDAAGTPAITVGGQYAQGARGLGAAAGECGLLAGTPGNGAGTVEDLDDSPACDDASARQLDSDPSGGGTGLVASTNPVTAIPTTCATPVMTFAARAYTAAETTAISRLTDGSLVSCRGRTFHFTPGIVSFNARQLRLGDPGSYYVFGQPAGWNPASGVQAAAPVAGDSDEPLCDAAASGTTVLIAGWTAITHTAGRVGICPNRPGAAGSDPLPAIYQQTVVPTEVGAAIVVPSVANRITRAFSCRFVFNGYPVSSDINQDNGNKCQPRRTYNLALSTGGEALVSSLRVMLTGAESVNTPNNLIRNRKTGFTVFRGNNTELCRTSFVTGMPNGGLTSSFDLKAPDATGTCDNVDIFQNELNGGRIKVDHMMELALLTIQQSIDITSAEVEINAVSGRAAAASSPASAGWNSPANVLTPNAAVATPQMPCGDFVCQVADPGRTRTPGTPFEHALSVSDFSFPGLFNSSNPDLDPSISSMRAVVKVKPSNTVLPAAWTSLFGNFIDIDNFLSPMRTFVELQTPEGGRCITQGSGMNSDQEISFDLLSDGLLDPNAGGGCNALVLNNASDLADLTLNVRFEMSCVPNWFHGVPFECLRSNLLYNPADNSPIWQIRPPDIEHVRLTTVTDTYSGQPPTSTVTVNAAPGTSRAAFNVAGSAWLPFSDLDINWNGEATAAPLFANDLVLHGLGSRMASAGQMGTVCCSPPDARTVDLIATIDGVERLTARVKFVDVSVDAAGNPVYEPGYGVEVLSWSRCPAAGCAAVLGANQNSPP